MKAYLKDILPGNRAIVGLIVLITACSITVSAEAATYYASASGSGTTCSSASPCSLQTAIGRAASGDTVIAKNGTYNGSFGTRAGGVVIKAENKWGATLKNNSSIRIFSIDHSNLTIKGFRFDGQKIGEKGGPLTIRSSVSNVIIEHNHFFNVATGAIAGGGTNTLKDIVIRHNLVEDTGWGGPGEAFYLGADTATVDSIFNVEIYGNTVRRYTTGGVDVKPNVVDVNVHHNIFEGQLYRSNPYKEANESTFMVRNKSHRVHNNVVRDATDARGSVIGISATRDNQVFKNVIKNMRGVTVIIGTRETGPGGTASQVYDSLFCNVNTYSVDAKAGLVVKNNSYGAALSSCDAEEQRILTEMQSLPGLSYDGAPVVSIPRAPTNLSAVFAK